MSKKIVAPIHNFEVDDYMKYLSVYIISNSIMSR